MSTNLSVKSKSQNMFKIAFGTKVAKVPSINSNSQKQQQSQQQQQQTSLLKISNVNNYIKLNYHQIFKNKIFFSSLNLI